MIDIALNGPIARITLSAPDRRNALTIAAMGEMSAALDTLAADPDLRVVVLTGLGKTFCAGADFTELERGLRPDLALSSLTDKLANLPLPTIAALNGGVYGAGLDLALACDIRIGVEGLKTQVPAAAIGVHYPGDALARAQAELGGPTARRLFLLADALTDVECLACGLVQALHPADALQDAADAMAQRIAALAPLAVQGMKRSLRRADDATARVTACFDSDDHTAALDARREKRKPVFQNR